MTISTALRKLYTALCGGTTNKKTAGDLINEIADNYSAPSVVTVDDSITEGGENPVTGGAIYTALSGKQDALTFDSVPTNESENPVKSGGVYTALAGKADSNIIPTYTVAEAGYTLKVNAAGTGLEWVAPAT